jgi:hypothetical protein
VKTQTLKIRASDLDLEALQEVAKTLVLNASTALWFVVHEKRRELALEAAKASGATGSKKRRPRAA